MANFCTRCGNPLPQGSDTCTVCNPVAAQPAAASGTTPAVGAIRPGFKHPAVIKIGGIEIMIRKVIMVIAAVEAFLFFMPLFSVSCQGMKISFSGFNAAFGKVIQMYGGAERVDGNIAAILLLIIPILLFLVFYTKKQLSFVNTKLFTTSTALSVAGFLGMIILSTTVTSHVEQQMLRVTFTFWYTLSLILYVVSSLISVGCVMFGKKLIQSRA